MSDDLVSRATIKAQMLRMGEPVAFGSDADIIDELAQALTEARASAAHWRRAIEIIATIIGLPEPEANFASKVRDAFDELRSQLHDANGVAELAIKHRDAAESELSALRARVREVVGPFAEAAADLDDADKDVTDIWEAPCAMQINVGHLRAARQLMEEVK